MGFSRADDKSVEVTITRKDSNTAVKTFFGKFRTEVDAVNETEGDRLLSHRSSHQAVDYTQPPLVKPLRAIMDALNATLDSDKTIESFIHDPVAYAKFLKKLDESIASCDETFASDQACMQAIKKSLVSLKVALDAEKHKEVVMEPQPTVTAMPISGIFPSKKRLVSLEDSPPIDVLPSIEGTTPLDNILKAYRGGGLNR